MPGARNDTPAKNGCEKGKLTTLGQVDTTGIDRSVERAMSAGTAPKFRPRKEVMIKGYLDARRAEAICNAAAGRLSCVRGGWPANQLTCWR